MKMTNLPSAKHQLSVGKELNQENVVRFQGVVTSNPSTEIPDKTGFPFCSQSGEDEEDGVVGQQDPDDQISHSQARHEPAQGEQDSSRTWPAGSACASQRVPSCRSGEKGPDTQAAQDKKFFRSTFFAPDGANINCRLTFLISDSTVYLDFSADKMFTNYPNST